MVILLCWLPLKENTFTFKTCLGSSVFSLKSYLAKCFLDLRFPGLVPLQPLDLSSANGIWFACLLSNYCCALLTIWLFQTICTACWLKICQPSPFRQLGHNWVSQGWSAHLNTAPNLSSILFFNALNFNTFQYFSILFNPLNTAPSLSSILFFNASNFNTFQYSSILWTQLQVCHPSSSSILWTSILFNTQYFADERLLQLLQKQSMKELTF